MATLVDWQIEELGRNRGMIQPYTPTQLNPASYDVRLSNEILVEVPRKESHLPVEWERVFIDTETYWLNPGEFILGSTMELVSVPDNMEAVFCLKSSRGREGYNHMLAGYIDPGFVGRVTLELHNCNRYNALPLYSGLLIGQLRFAGLAERPRKSYRETGRYHLDLQVTPSKG